MSLISSERDILLRKVFSEMVQTYDYEFCAKILIPLLSPFQIDTDRQVRATVSRLLGLLIAYITDVPDEYTQSEDHRNRPIKLNVLHYRGKSAVHSSLKSKSSLIEHEKRLSNQYQI
jgi:hypothetical protein